MRKGGKSVPDKNIVGACNVNNRQRNFFVVVNVFVFALFYVGVCKAVVVLACGEVMQHGADVVLVCRNVCHKRKIGVKNFMLHICALCAGKQHVTFVVKHRQFLFADGVQSGKTCAVKFVPERSKRLGKQSDVRNGRWLARRFVAAFQ